MKILFLGLGSIGQRHLQNAKKIFNKAKFFSYRKKNKNLIIKNSVTKKKNLSKHYGIYLCKSSKEALSLKPDITFVCNPSIFHFRDSLTFANKGSNLFIEKPLYAKNNQVKKLINVIERKKIKSMIGFQLRYHPAIILTKKIIKSKKFGDIKTAYFDNLTHLPSHHPYEDYSKGYASKKNLGGGALSSLIHEIDLIVHFFGYPRKVLTTKFNSGVIKCDVEDNVFSLLKFKSRKNFFFVNLNLSFTNVEEKREFRILSKKKLLLCDLIKNSIKIYSNDSKKLLYKKNFKFHRNDLFLKELKDFKKCIFNNKESLLSVKNNYLTTKLFNAMNSNKIIT